MAFYGALFALAVVTPAVPIPVIAASAHALAANGFSFTVDAPSLVVVDTSYAAFSERTGLGGLIAP